MDKVTNKTVSTNRNLSEEKGEPKRVSNRGPSAYQPNALPLGHTGSQRVEFVDLGFICVRRVLKCAFTCDRVWST